jgi:hypothetical protein
MILTTLVLLFVASWQPAAQNPTLDSVMREKLANTQQALTALVGGDSVALEAAADALGRVTETEVMSWHTGAQPTYSQLATAYLRAVTDLRQAASVRDTDAALEAYAALVTSCTRCHAYVRRLSIVSAGKASQSVAGLVGQGRRHGGQ